MERLTFVKCPRHWNKGRHPTPYSSGKTFQEVVDRLAYYEDLEEQGQLFIKPFKEGETTYYADEDTGRALMGYVASYEILSDGAVYVEFTNVEHDIEWVGVQLTLAEAEKKYS